MNRFTYNYGSALLCVLFLGCITTLELHAQERTAFVNANLIDGVSDTPILGATVIIQGTTIEQITTGAEVPSGVSNVVDLEGRFLMPGLMDAHVHINSLDGAHRALASGITTARSASTAYYADVSIREMVREGVVPGPDIVATGVFVTPNIGGAILSDARLARLIDGVETEEEIRHLVRINIDRGAQFIKSRGTERAGLPDTDPRKQVYTEAQLGWMVDEAGKQGVPVMVHAHGDEGARAAILAGARSIEHGTYLSESSLQLMKERGTFLVPTYTVVTDLLEPGGDYDNALLKIRAGSMLPRLERTIKDALRIGVPIVASTDTGYGPDSVVRVSRELMHFVRFGMSPLQAIQTATRVPAALFGIDGRVGTLQAGMEADMIVIEENPLENIGAIQDVLMVVSNGKIAINRLPFGK